MTMQADRLIRVFPRRTKATPTDELAMVGWPDMFPPECDRIEVSVTFTWDKPLAERLANAWSKHGNVQIGGPAYDDCGERFDRGRYLRPGYTITSRGCPNRCWFCKVPIREGGIRELPIVDGWNILDSNLLACSRGHVECVFEMIGRQKRQAEFTGGLEAARLQDWHVHLLASLHPRPSVFFAYDMPDDYEPLRMAGKKMLAAGFTRASHNLRCYCLVGYPKDTMEAAERRLRQAWSVGFMPMAMLWRNERGDRLPEWRTFQRYWARPASVAAMCNKKRTMTQRPFTIEEV